MGFPPKNAAGHDCLRGSWQNRQNLAERGGSYMSYDFTPLFRTAIGFDRLAQVMDSAARSPGNSSFPPYDIAKTGSDSYTLTMAIAGFGPEDIELVVQDNTLVVSGRVNAPQDEGEILHRGIARRAFERRFALADHVEVTGAEMNNGLLRITVQQIIPEALKPRRIPVKTVSTTPEERAVTTEQKNQVSQQPQQSIATAA
ncbi:Small heat shock protein IbpA [Acetobacter pomorum DM001]|uniref:Small heat shock protein IbpA n=3 Tax=Acetobacter TaxID=434 RepID=F1YQC0_9PROT|nr:Small heat shock protein IbpA [Acetobacter pomorum DM001]KGB25829.1 16 kDa heat shock protein A [Acetobacter pomorum]